MNSTLSDRYLYDFASVCITRTLKPVMTSTRTMMIPFHGMTSQMRTSTAPDVLVRWLPIQMANVVLELPMAPKLEVCVAYAKGKFTLCWTGC